MSGLIEGISYNDGSARVLVTPAHPSPHLAVRGGAGMAIPHRICSRRGCHAAGVHKRYSQRKSYRCTKHYRFYAMVQLAKKRGLAAPTFQELEKLIPPDMLCVGCGREMAWLRTEDSSRVMTLQHDRSGDCRFICNRCNTRHSVMPGDSFYDLPHGHKYCAGCAETKPVDAFAVDKSRAVGRKGRCRECCKRFYENNRAYWQERQQRLKARRRD